jgi:hypothetical protein
MNYVFKPNEPMKILIRNLSRNMTETELKAMFEEHGAVQSCSLVNVNPNMTFKV